MIDVNFIFLGEELKTHKDLLFMYGQPGGQPTILEGSTEKATILGYY